MKKIYLIALSLVLSFPIVGQEVAKNVIVVDVIRNLVSLGGTYRWMGQYERALNDKFTAVVALEAGEYGSYSQKTIPLNGGAIQVNEEYSLKGNMLLLEGRFYPFRKNKVAPRGFFVGTYFKNYWLKERLDHLDEEYRFSKKENIQAWGIDVGYKMFNSWFVLEPVIGFGTIWNSGVGEDSRLNQQMLNFQESDYSMRLALNIGVCF